MSPRSKLRARRLCPFGLWLPGRAARPQRDAEERAATSIASRSAPASPPRARRGTRSQPRLTHPQEGSRDGTLLRSRRNRIPVEPPSAPSWLSPRSRTSRRDSRPCSTSRRLVKRATFRSDLRRGFEGRDKVFDGLCGAPVAGDVNSARLDLWLVSSLLRSGAKRRRRLRVVVVISASLWPLSGAEGVVSLGETLVSALVRTSRPRFDRRLRVIRQAARRADGYLNLQSPRQTTPALARASATRSHRHRRLKFLLQQVSATYLG